MMKVGRLLVFLFTSSLVCTGSSWAVGPQLEILPGSSVSLAGSERVIQPQIVNLRPAWQPGLSFRSGEALNLPRISTFGLDVDVFQNQEFVGDLDPITGEVSLDFPLWGVEDDGFAAVKYELGTTLTTGVPDTRTCSNSLYCFGPDLPEYCQGTPWDPQTGNLRLVGITNIPSGPSSLQCDWAFIFIIEARITPGDADLDGIIDAIDNCPQVSNSDQADPDADGIGTSCDNCTTLFNPAQHDADGDGTGNACEPLLVNFQPQSAPVPVGYQPDYGVLINPSRSFGWLNATGLQFRDRNILLADQLLDTLVFTPSPRAWEGVLPGGLYDVFLAIGDPAFQQGPQLLTSEDEVIFQGVTTPAGQNLFADLPARLVADGRLTVEIGGGGGNSTWNYVTAVESAHQPFWSRFVNFQPAASPVPLGFVPDSGLVFDAVRGYGWDAAVQTRDRAVLSDPVLNTFVHPGIGEQRTWNIVVPADYYQVELAVGDPSFAQGPQAVSVEGQSWLANQTTAAGEFIKLSGRVLILDGDLTVGIGQAGGRTVLNYVSLVALPRDFDGDGVVNLNDNCYEFPNAPDLDGDGIGDPCDADVDGDGAPNTSDCAPLVGGAFAPPVEVQGLKLERTVPDTDGWRLKWQHQNGSAGVDMNYDVVTLALSALLADGSFQTATCLVDDRGTESLIDNSVPPAGDGLLYLVRGENVCGVGTYGLGSGAVAPDPRTYLDATSPCP